jgi:hypothetical protein
VQGSRERDLNGRGVHSTDGIVKLAGRQLDDAPVTSVTSATT